MSNYSAKRLNSIRLKVEIIDGTNNSKLIFIIISIIQAFKKVKNYQSCMFCRSQKLF